MMETIQLPLLLILDANVIIAAHEFGVWDRIVETHEVFIPSVVIDAEIYFYRDLNGTPVSIDLRSQEGKSITVMSCTADELAAFSEQLDSVTDQEIHAGEKEALVILSKNPKYTFSTFDHAAIQVLALLGFSDRGISFEHLLKSCGVTKGLQYKHTEEFYNVHLEKGQQNRIQGIGLRKVTLSGKKNSVKKNKSCHLREQHLKEEITLEK
jgi:hypothetical protein